MDLFAIGTSVTVSDVVDDTGVATDGVAIKTLPSTGTIVEAREYPPLVDPESPGAIDVSPHYLINLKDADGHDHLAWFCAPRVSA